MSYTFFWECFISGLKDEIQTHVLTNHPQNWLEAAQHVEEAQHVVFSQHCKPSFIPCPLPPNLVPHPTPLKIQKLTREEMVERQLKDL
jgi:hypothetical protein